MAKVSFKQAGGPASMVPTPTKSANPALPVNSPVPAPSPAPVPPSPPVVPNDPAPIAASTPAVEIEVANSAPPEAVPAADEGTAVYTPSPPPIFYDGSEQENGFDPGDLVLPRLVIVQKVGDLSNLYSPGTIMLGGQLVLVPAPKETAVSPAIRLVILGIGPTGYSEKLEGGNRGNFFRTKEEVVNAGGTTDWNESKATNKPLYQSVAVAFVAVEQPVGVDAQQFPLAIEGKNYALALYTMKGTAYTNAAKHFWTAVKIGWLRGKSFRHGFWKLSSQLKKFGSNFAYIPVVAAGENTTETFRKAIKDLIKF